MKTLSTKPYPKRNRMPAKIKRNRVMIQEEEEDGEEYISDHPDHKKHMELVFKRMRKNKIINEH